jgi:hypothetical protein
MKRWMLLVWWLGFSMLQTESSFAGIESPLESDEIPYEQLVRELNAKVNKRDHRINQSNAIDPFETLKIHMSFGFVQTYSTLLVNSRTVSRLEDGIQLGVGIDLFSPEWVAEGVLKNFGQSSMNDSTLALREFDLRLTYLQEAPKQKLKIRVVNGLGGRYLRFNSPWEEFYKYQTTPVYLMGFGFLVPVGSHFDFDFEVQGHVSLINDTIDRHGLSLVFRLNNVF